MFRYYKRLLSLILSVLIVVNCSMPTVFAIGGDESAGDAAQKRAENFINFYQDASAVELSMANLTTNDYYAMFNFMSNWFEPGKTTLDDIVNNSDAIVDTFSTALGRGGEDEFKNSLKDLVQSFGNDIVNGINGGSCIIVNSSGSRVNGYELMGTFLATIPDEDEGEYSGYIDKLNSSKLYYENKNNLAFDFSSNAMRAAFQTIFSYNTDMFLMKEGIASLDVFYLDAVGNLWGATSNTVPADFDWNNEYNSGGSLDSSKLSEVYLILPSCLNPSTFTPNVTNRSSQAELRMPMMNRFVLSALVTEDNLKSSSTGRLDIEERFVPIYDVLSSNAADVVKKSNLNVIGVHSLSPYTFNTADIAGNKWSLSERKQDFADFVYNSESFVIDKNALKNNGIAQFSTNTYIVFATSLANVTAANGNNSADLVIDLETGFLSTFNPNWGESGFTVFDTVNKVDSQSSLDTMENVQKLLTYFLSPTILKLNEVSMNFYKYDATANTEDDLSVQFQEFLTANDENISVKSGNDSYRTLSEIGEDGLTSAEVSKMGLAGMSLYLNDIVLTMNESDGSNAYYLTAPDNMVHSKFVNNLLKLIGADSHNSTTYNSIKGGTPLDANRDLLNLMFLGKFKSGELNSDSYFSVKGISMNSMNYNYSTAGSVSPRLLTIDFYKKFLDLLSTADMYPALDNAEIESALSTAGTYAYDDNTKAVIQDIRGFPLGSIGEGFSAGYGIIYGSAYDNTTISDNEIPLYNKFLLGYKSYNSSTGVYSDSVYGVSDIGLLVNPKDSVLYTGSSTWTNSFYIPLGRMLSMRDKLIKQGLSENKGHGDNLNKNPVEFVLDASFTRLLDVQAYETYNLLNASGSSHSTPTDSFKDLIDYITAFYGYSLFFPSEYMFGADGYLLNSSPSRVSVSLFNNSKVINDQSGIFMRDLNQDYLMGMYLGYIVDMMGLGTCSANASMTFGTFSSPFLPNYSISAKGGNLAIDNYLKGTSTGVERLEDKSFEEMQKDLISRIYGLTSSEPNAYRDGLIINILNGVILAIHRTITGTWGSSISTVTSGSSNTYQSVTGYIYTPTLEELPFTATMMDNYLEIYILCMMFVIFILVLMVLLHMRSWREGLITCVIMSICLLLPYILISNCVNVSNKISDRIFSDRFDFWAVVDHAQKEQSLSGFSFLDEKDQWYVEANATNDSTLTGNMGVKIKWMSPKKVDNFQLLYSDADYSNSFATNMTIFKWLFNSTIYDSEFVDTDVFGSFVYRQYTNIALEAESYYGWANDIRTDLENMGVYTYKGNSYSVPTSFSNTLTKIGEDNVHYFEGGIGRLDSNFFLSSTAGSRLIMSSEKIMDINKVAQSLEGAYSSTDSIGDKIGLWGALNTDIADKISAKDSDSEMHNTYNPGIVSNLPESSVDTGHFSGDDISEISKAIFLKNTESPYYYFYSVLKYRYADGASGGFKDALLKNDIFKVNVYDHSGVDILGLNTTRNIHGSVRDFLDLEGLFSYVIPYLKLSNDYVVAWQEVNGSEIPSYNFKYSLDEDGNVKDIGKDPESGKYSDSLVDSEGNAVVSSDYINAVNDKNARNRVWNMYSPWVDSLYATDIVEKVDFVNKNIYIEDTLNPYAYFQHGRPMIFSEADMIAKGYNYSDLTEIERKMQAVLEKTYEDLLYLINYYSLDDDVLLSAAAMYATFNFNAEFSDNNFLQPSIMLYPQSFELRNFNYDAYIRLALLNTTGESIFAEEDLYERIIRKTSIFTGILLIVSDLVACILIPLIKFIMLVALLFLGLLVCISCVLNPPEKIYQNTLKYVLVPTFAFTALNIIFAFCMSLVVGEGLTAYVGSKTPNLATNDPTTTLFIMALFGIAYVFVSWKIFKMVIDAYKQFGLSSFITTVGIMSSAVAAATAGVAKKGLKAIGSGATGAIGAGVGALTAEKGERLAGAFEGAQLGTRGVIDRRIRDKRILERMGAGEEGTDSKKVTDSINEKASAPSGDTSSSTKDTKVNETPSTHSSDESSFKVKVKKVQKQRADKSLNNIQVERRKTGTQIQSKIDGKSYRAKDIVLKPMGSSAPMDKNKKIYINGNVSNVKKPSTNSVRSVRVSSSSKSKIDKKY